MQELSDCMIIKKTDTLQAGQNRDFAATGTKL